MSIFEDGGGIYINSGDYLIPNLALLDEQVHIIGKYGRLHLDYIKRHRRALYTRLLTTCKLNHYLHEVDTEASARFEMLVEQIAANQGVTEELKARDQMRWVGLMNNIRHRAGEIVLDEFVYA